MAKTKEHKRTAEPEALNTEPLVPQDIASLEVDDCTKVLLTRAYVGGLRVGHRQPSNTSIELEETRAWKMIGQEDPEQDL